MGFDADGLGNHHFDQGQQFLREQLIPLADFHVLSANVVVPERARRRTSGSRPPSTTSRRMLGVVGFTNGGHARPALPGRLGPFQVDPAAPEVNAEVGALRRNDTDAVVALGHEGRTPARSPTPTGPLSTSPTSSQGVDVVIGDHNDIQVLTTRPNGVLLTENRGKGVRFTRVRLRHRRQRGRGRLQDGRLPPAVDASASRPDPASRRRSTSSTRQLAPIFGAVIGNSTVPVPRSARASRLVGRPERAGSCESLIGDVVTDAMRTTYSTDFAITNSGGLRADLTCPTTDTAGDFCRPFTPPPYPITRGQVFAVLPFGNFVVTLSVNGAELKSMLENGVSTMPAVNGRFPQVSGLCFTYDIAAAAGSRVTGAVRQAADGTCTGAAVDLTAGSTYTIAANDFIANGGDGYPNFSSRIAIQDFMDEVTADYIVAAPAATIAPSIQSRIVCTGAGCPVVLP